MTTEVGKATVLTFAFGSAHAGLATVGYQLYNADGSANGGRVTAGVVEVGTGVGSYQAVKTFGSEWTGSVVADTGGGSPVYTDAGAIVVLPVEADVSGIASDLTDVKTKVDANLDAAVSTRLATSGYTAPDNADIAAVKAKTDNLPSDPADASDIAAAFTALDAAVAALGTPAQDDALAAAAAAITALGSPAQADDARLDHLDADISSRATPADVDVTLTGDLADVETTLADIQTKVNGLPVIRVPA